MSVRCKEGEWKGAPLLVEEILDCCDPQASPVSVLTHRGGPGSPCQGRYLGVEEQGGLSHVLHAERKNPRGAHGFELKENRAKVGWLFIRDVNGG